MANCATVSTSDTGALDAGAPACSNNASSKNILVSDLSISFVIELGIWQLYRRRCYVLATHFSVGKVGTAAAVDMANRAFRPVDIQLIKDRGV
jgi:hypothetical protein